MQVKQRSKLGSTAVDEAKRVAIEEMNRKGAMRSAPSGQGYYECFDPDQCAAKCCIRKNTAGTYVTKWKEDHKEGCNQIGKQPARMQHTARTVVLEHAVSKTRKDIQGEYRAKALSGRAFGAYRLAKAVQRARAGVPSHLSSKDGLAEFISAMPHKAIQQNDVMVGFAAWDPPGVEVDVAHPDDWDANAPTPMVPVGEVDSTENHVDVVDADDTATDEDASDDQEQDNVKAEEGEVMPENRVPLSSKHSVSVLTCKSAFLRMLQCSSAMRHIDGTFDVAPRFSALINIGFTEEKVYYPVSYVLAKSPGTKSYESSAHVLRVFEIIEEMAKELLGVAGVTAWKMFRGDWMRDGGKGYAKAIRLYFPNCRQRMCWFHLMQAVRRRKTEFPRVYEMVIETLRKLHLCADQAEFALGMDVMLKQMSKSRDGRTFVRYWNNTHFGTGRIDGYWSVSFAGEVTTNNALEGFNGRMADMVFGHGKKRRSAMWCLDRYVVAMSMVLDLQNTLIEDSDATMWTEWRNLKDRAAQNKAAKCGLDMRAVMLQTHCVGESHKVLPRGVGLSPQAYAQLAGNRASSLRNWLSWMDVRHVTDDACTCWTFMEHETCKHVWGLRVLDEKQITPVRLVEAPLEVTQRAPRKNSRGGHSLLDSRLKELDVNAKRMKTETN